MSHNDLAKTQEGQHAMLKVYNITSNTLFDAVTVVARDTGEALRNFALWLGRHAPEVQDSVLEIVTLTDDDLAVQPQLRDATSSGLIGVAWWVGHREGWLITAPDGDAVGAIAPPYTPINCYVFTGSDDLGTAYVFSETLNRAIAILHHHSLGQSGLDANYEHAVELSPWLLVENKVTMREQMFERATGVGMECEDGDWCIFPVDHEAPLTTQENNGLQDGHHEAALGHYTPHI